MLPRFFVATEDIEDVLVPLFLIELFVFIAVILSSPLGSKGSNRDAFLE
jgi:hypothetical protein